jgi:TatD DNase family protein
MFVDSHCHLTFPGLIENLSEIRAAMATAHVTHALCIDTTIEEFEDVYALTQRFDNFWATVGVHPDKEGIHEPTVDELVQLAQRPKVVGIGETGLDYYRLEGRSIKDMQWQRDRFRTHIQASLQANLPLIIHTRAASHDTMSLLREERVSSVDLRGVFHCFTETMEVARVALDLGFYISFSGILTFKSAVDLRQVAQYVPLDRCLIETDSPYLAPMPHRGKTNTPAWVPLVAVQLAELKSHSVEQVAQATSENFSKLFNVDLSQEKL